MINAIAFCFCAAVALPVCLACAAFPSVGFAMAGGLAMMMVVS
jgi:hypothetical protein